MRLGGASAPPFLPMIIIHDLRLIYIRVPKTASTSFVSALDELKPEHVGAVHENAKALPGLLKKRPELQRYRRAGFIRHPYQWARSAYNHWHRNHDMFRVKPPQTLKGFVRMLPATPAEWLRDEHGTPLCEAWRTEDMPEIMAGLGLELHHKNIKFSEPYDPDEEMRGVIRERFADDFAIGGYDGD